MARLMVEARVAAPRGVATRVVYIHGPDRPLQFTAETHRHDPSIRFPRTLRGDSP